MARKRMTPEQKAEKNRKQRETYQKARKAGFTRDDSRSIEKALRKAPEVLKEPTTELISLVGSMRKFSKWMLEAVEPEPEKEPKKKGKKKAKKPQPKVENDPLITGLKNLGNFIMGKPPEPEIPDFSELVKKHPEASTKKLKEMFRQMGGRISNKDGDAIIRDVRRKELDEKKITRFKTDEEGNRVIRFRRPTKNFQFTKKRYVYVMGYDVEDKHGQQFKRYIHIPSNDKLSEDELADEVMDYWEQELESGDDEKYTQVEIITESIYLVMAYDLTKYIPKGKGA